MPNDPKTQAQWDKDFIELARRSNVSLRGKAPGKNDTANQATYKKIINCPLWRSNGVKSGTQLNLFNKRTSACNCKCGYEQYHGVHAPVVNNDTPTAAVQQQQQQQPTIITIPFNIPTKPDPICLSN